MKDKKIEFVDEGIINGVWMTSEKAYHFYKMVERGLSIYIDSKTELELEDPLVKRYIETLEWKIKEGKRIALKFENGK